MTRSIYGKVRRSLGLRLGLVALCVGTASCVPKLKGLGMRDVQLDVPERFGEAATEESDLDAIRLGGIFADPELVALIEEALEYNRELLTLGQEINVSNAEIIARRGEYLPRVDLGVGGGVEKVGRYTSQGASDASTEMEPGKEVPEHLTDFRIALRASWEIDIWKKLRNAKKAAQIRYLSSIEGRNFVVTGLIAELANSYYELEALDNKLEVIETNLALLREVVEAVKLQQAAARVTALGVQRFEAELRKYESRKYEVRQQIVQTENRINGLCGRFPQPVVRRSDRFAELSPASLAPGLPSQMLQRRPDIRAAELDLEAAKLDVKVARARYFPSLSIDANAGIQAFSLLKFGVMPESLMYDAAAGLLSPLLNRSAIKAGYLTANSKQMQAVFGYEQAVIRGFTEVVNDLARIENVDRSYELKAEQVEVLEQAIETSNRLFRSARADYLEVLTTRRETLEAQIELIETRQTQMGARIDLYRSLGGGWPESDEPIDEDAASTAAPVGE